jgi:cytidine deaminase
VTDVPSSPRSSPTDRPVLDGPPAGMDAGDRELLDTATTVLAARYRTGVHEVAAALRLADGTVVTGLHVEASAGRASVCAESAALSAAVIAGEPVVSVVGVLRRPGGSLHLIEPCGVCAELLADHAPGARVWVAVDDGFGPVAVADLLPFRRRRSARPASGVGSTGPTGDSSTTPEV